jgi:hypothetical protein
LKTSGGGTTAIIDVQRIEDYETNELILDAFEIERINVFALLFQTGYLTIKEIKPISSTQSIYRLSYPNEEVKESFLEYIGDLTVEDVSPTTDQP